MHNNQARLKSVIAPLQKAMANFTPDEVLAALNDVVADDALVRLCHPFGDVRGGAAFYEVLYQPLVTAMPDLERRDMIVVAGTTPEGHDWIGTMGNYMGTFTAPLLDIMPTGQLAHMRYHEFFRVQDGKIVEINLIIDLPELMMLANVWPMAPQLGAFLCTPAPMSGDGLTCEGDGTKAMGHVINMLTDLCRHPSDPDPKVMNLPAYWHSKFNWYGPAGIGTTRGISGFRHWHQKPFLRAMPDRKVDSAADRNASQETADLTSHWVAAGDYVCETGWPNMRMKLSGDGWMGIAPSDKIITLRSVDFWRLEDGLIRENWVQIDVLYLYEQIGVDVLGRMREFNKARRLGAVQIDDGLS